MYFRTLLLLSLFTSSLFSLELNKPLPSLKLEGKNGSLVNGKAFDSATIHDKVRVIFYVDPDEKDLNEALSDRLKKEDFDKSKFGSVAVINLAATWLPNYVIQKLLAQKQKEFPETIYVFDREKVGVKAWSVEDDNSDVIITDKEGKVLYYHPGKVTDMQEVVDIIKANI